jgi:hypothetical protein
MRTTSAQGHRGLASRDLDQQIVRADSIVPIGFLLFGSQCFVFAADGDTGPQGNGAWVEN